MSHMGIHIPAPISCPGVGGTAPGPWDNTACGAMGSQFQTMDPTMTPQFQAIPRPISCTSLATSKEDHIFLCTSRLALLLQGHKHGPGQAEEATGSVLLCLFIN